MTAFVLSADTNIDALASKAGGDTYDTNGWKLTIDQDSRAGLNQTINTTLGNMTINAAKGGEIHIDATSIWLIPFNEGSGLVPAHNTVITSGTGSGKLIGVQPNLTSFVLGVGSAVPSSGFLRVKQKTGTYSAGALTGITATASNAGRVGWLEIAGDEAGTINANRLGTFRVTGAWFSLGVTSGAADQTVQIPNNGRARYVPGVFIGREAGRYPTYTKVGSVITLVLAAHAFEAGMSIELAFTTGALDGISDTFEVASVIDSSTFTVIRAAGVDTSGDCFVEFLEFYPNAGTVTSLGYEAQRGKVVHIADTGLVTIGSSGVNTSYLPGAGRSIVVPNIFFENATTAKRTDNGVPNATIATRYDFTCTGGGVLVIDKACMNWYLSASQAYSVNISNSCFTDAILLSEVASPMKFNKVGVGNKATTALTTSPLTMTYCYAGGAFTDCVWQRVAQAASGAHTVVINDIAGFTFTRNTIRANTIRGNATTYAVSATRMKNCVFANTLVIQGSFALATCDGITITNTVYYDCVTGATVSTYAMYIFNLSLNTVNCVFSGLSLPGTNAHPYTAILIAATGCSNIKLRNIGTRAAPVSLGSLLACGLIYAISTNCSDFKFQRIYVSNTRTGIMTGDNSCKNITEENVFGDYADAVDVMACLNMKRKGMGGTGALTAQTSVYGTHWRDGFISAVTGRIAIVMNEPTADTTAQVTLTGGANFTSAGGLYMPVVGQSATFEMPEYILGHTGFQNAILIMAGGTATNYTYEYAIDKNDGNGFSVMTAGAYTATTLGAALNGIAGIDASKGFKLKLKITTGTTNTTAITSVYVLTNSTTTAQDYQYPLDVTDFTFAVTDEAGAPVTGFEYRIYLKDPAAGIIGTTELDGAESYGNSSRTYRHTFSTSTDVELQIIKEGYEEFLNTYTLNTTPQSVALKLRTERNI